MRPPSIQWYFKQWLGDNKVQGMDWDAYGMHFHLINLACQETPPGSLPDDMALIRRWLRSPSDEVWRRVQPQVFSAWTLRTDRRWYNSGLTETFASKERYRNRYEICTKSPPNPMKIEVKENLASDLDSKAFFFSVEPFDSEGYVRRINEAHPRSVSSTAHREIVQALERIVLARNITRKEAAEYLLGRTQLYAEKTKLWPKQDRQFIPRSQAWFADSLYEEPEEFWEKSRDSKSGNDYLREIGERIKREAIQTPQRNSERVSRAKAGSGEN